MISIINDKEFWHYHYQEQQYPLSRCAKIKSHLICGYQLFKIIHLLFYILLAYRICITIINGICFQWTLSQSHTPWVPSLLSLLHQTSINGMWSGPIIIRQLDVLFAEVTLSWPHTDYPKTRKWYSDLLEW